MANNKKTTSKKETKTKPKVVEATLTSNKKEKLSVLKPHQKSVSNFLRSNSISIVLGEAGCAKDFVQMFRAIEGINDGEFDKLVITKPIVEMGMSIGFLPGDEEKLAPYKRSFYNNLTKIVGKSKMGSFKDKVEFEHIGFQRGNTLPEYSVIILSEAQNMTLHELISYTTRVPGNSKLFVNGDSSQSDIGRKSGLNDYLQIMNSVDGVGIVVLDPKVHQMRSRIITDINKNYISLMEQRGLSFKIDMEKIKHVVL
jgi:phosphate starvation-inducible PhoH-like protein